MTGTAVIRDFQTVVNLSNRGVSYNNVCERGYFIFHAYARSVENPVHSGVYALNCAFLGEEFYRAKDVLYRLTRSNYLVLNDDTPRSSFVRSDNDVESLSINFSADFVNSFYASSTESELDLDEQQLPTRRTVRFSEELQENNPVVSPVLMKIRYGLMTDSFGPLELDETVSLLLDSMLHCESEIRTRMNSMACKKASTREELYKRLVRSRDYIYSCYKDPITIEDLARVASLNQHYFLREFKKLFGTSPHAYIRDLRLKEVRRLLNTTDRLFRDICLEVGYSDPSSLRKVFKREFQRSPRPRQNELSRSRTQIF